MFHKEPWRLKLDCHIAMSFISSSLVEIWAGIKHKNPLFCKGIFEFLFSASMPLYIYIYKRSQFVEEYIHMKSISTYLISFLFL